MNRHAFAYRAAVADAHTAVASGEGKVLRFAADHCAFVNATVRTNRREAFDARAGANLCALADARMAFDDCVGADDDTVAELRPGINEGCRMNRHGDSLSHERDAQELMRRAASADLLCVAAGCYSG